MSNNKFRAWDPDRKRMLTSPEWVGFKFNVEGELSAENYNFKGNTQKLEVMQFIGITDNNDVEYFIGDIGEFENGDRFVLKMEGWLEVYVAWIGDPECEDQARDLYRISRAKVVGNIHQHPELLEV